MRGRVTPVVTPVSGFDGEVAPEPFAPTPHERAQIDAVWARAVAEKPAIYDGEVLLAESHRFEGRRLKIRYVRTGFSTLMWRRSLGFPAGGLGNAFAAAVVVSRDGAALLGRMAPGTANAGGIYFPCGTPDPSDILGERVDLEGSILRELEEETGLCAPLVTPSDRRLVVVDGGLVACLRRFDTTLDAEELEAAARRHIKGETDPELDAFTLARSLQDLTSASPAYVHAALPALLAANEAH